MSPNNKPTKETLEKWHKDPKNWRWGIFYFNKDDKRIFPPKRIKQLGWTINYANPMSILAIVVVIAVIFIVVSYLKPR